MPEMFLKLHKILYNINFNYVIVISRAWSGSKLFIKVISRQHSKHSPFSLSAGSTHLQMTEKMSTGT